MPCALLREVRRDARRLHDAARIRRQDDDRAGAERSTEAAEARVGQRRAGSLRCGEPRAEVAADEVGLSLSVRSRLLQQARERAAELDLVHTRLAYRAGNRHKRCSRLVGSSGGAEPGRPETCDECELRQRLDVEHQRWCAADTAFVWARRSECRERRPTVQELDERSLLSGNEAIWNDDRAHLDPTLEPTLPQRGLDGCVDRGRRCDHDVLRADGAGRQHSPVDDEVRRVGEQHFVLARGRFPFGAVRDDHRTRSPAAHRLELRRSREPGAATSGQPCSGDPLTQLLRAQLERQRAVTVEMRGHPDRAPVLTQPAEQTRRKRRGADYLGSAHWRPCGIPCTVPRAVPLAASS